MLLSLILRVWEDLPDDFDPELICREALRGSASPLSVGLSRSIPSFELRRRSFDTACSFRGVQRNGG